MMVLLPSVWLHLLAQVHIADLKMASCAVPSAAKHEYMDSAEVALWVWRW